MAESNALKILFVLDILKRTDEKHPVNSSQIIEELKNKGVKAERKSIGKYVQILRDEMDYDIVLCDNKNLGWYMRGLMFEDYELKMLADSVASAKFLTIDNSRKLIKKILTLATKGGEDIIKATTLMDSSLKLTDKKFAIKFDVIMRAIVNHEKVSFKYLERSTGNKLVPRKNGKTYVISPYYLGVWGYEYFVLANTDPYDNVSVYRVEMMDSLESLMEPARNMNEIRELGGIGKKGRTFADFIKESVNLKSGDVVKIKISGKNSLRNEVVKKFGNTIAFKDKDKDRFWAFVDAADSRGFYEWIAQYGANMKIEAPGSCIDKYKSFLIETLEQY